MLARRFREQIENAVASEVSKIEVWGIAIDCTTNENGSIRVVASFIDKDGKLVSEIARETVRNGDRLTLMNFDEAIKFRFVTK